ncbi:hypothetical protein EAE96_010320 [Botrytis aclada]|nr:hypothetical protein EAE96_010320 [Botrytis aclada]
MAFTTRSFSFITLSHPSSSLSPYSPSKSSKSRSKQPKYSRKNNRSKPQPKRNYSKEQAQDQELLTEVFKGEKDEECPCPSCAYPVVDSGESESSLSSSSSSSSSSLNNHDVDSEESSNTAKMRNRSVFTKPRNGEAGGAESKMKWGLAWLRGRRMREKGCGYGWGYRYGDINTCAGIS